MPLDHYLTLGRSGLRVSPFALGAMTFGEDAGGAGSSVEESEKILATYLDRGGNFVDTANFYTNGHSEKILGDWFAANHGTARPRRAGVEVLRQHVSGRPERRRRRAVVDQAPVARDVAPPADRPPGLVLAAQLGPPHTDRGNPARAGRSCDATGTIRYIGFSNTPGWVTAQAQTTAVLRGWTPLIALQVEYSLLARTVEGELAPLALDQDMALVPWSPLRNGFLSGKYRRGAEVGDSARAAYRRRTRATPSST